MRLVRTTRTRNHHLRENYSKQRSIGRDQELPDVWDRFGDDDDTYDSEVLNRLIKKLKRAANGDKKLRDLLEEYGQVVDDIKTSMFQLLSAAAALLECLRLDVED